MSTIHLGAHNLHDEAGVPTFFADVVIFTEAIAPSIVAKARQRRAQAAGRLAGFSTAVCAQQRDLVVAYRRKTFRLTGRSYHRYVEGVAKVTPNRGTYLVFLEHRETGTPVVVVAEHRINAAFQPWIRGERTFRTKAWWRHTDGTLETIQRLKDSGYTILAGGDLNTPHGVSGYEGKLGEVGDGFDRLGSNGRIGRFERLSRQGSDHPRIRALVTLRRKP